MSSIDTGLRERVESNVSTAASNVDTSSFEHEALSSEVTGLERSIASAESQLDKHNATIETPPMKTITESSKKGSSSTQVVNEEAIKKAEAARDRLVQEITTLKAEQQSAQSNASSALKTKETSQAELDENVSQLSTFNEAEELLTKFSGAFSGTDGFANKGEEDAALKRLSDYTDKIKEWGDVDGDGIDDGEHFTDAINGFIYGEGGYLSQDRKYESDYIAAGEVAPWKQTPTTSESTDSSEDSRDDSHSHSELRDYVMGNQ